MTKSKNDIIKIWEKIELNSCYNFPPIPDIPLIFYDKDKALQITKEGKENLKLIQEKIKNVIS